jgi:hypothetical protein
MGERNLINDRALFAAAVYIAVEFFKIFKARVDRRYYPLISIVCGVGIYLFFASQGGAGIDPSLILDYIAEGASTGLTASGAYDLFLTLGRLHGADER